jgi:septum site-determining protein MinC
VALLLKSAQLPDLEKDLAGRFGEQPDFFDNDPLLIDLSPLEGDVVPDFPGLLGLLRRYRLQPLAVRGGGLVLQQAATAAGLLVTQDATLLRSSQATDTTLTVQNTAPIAPPAEVQQTLPAMVIDKPLRSGQQVYAKGRDLIVTAMVNPGAEVIADGNIHVYAPLRGKAMAGARGYTEARIFAQAMEPELISIAGIYRTSDTPLPPEVRGKAAQVRLLSDTAGDKLLLDPIL